MKIVIFTENNKGGGMDTFIASLVRNWPDSDDNFTIICNSNHPGISYMKEMLPNNTSIILHSLPLNLSLIHI